MINGLRPKLDKINDTIAEFERNPSSAKSKQTAESVNRLFHEAIDLIKHHEPSIDDMLELQMTVNRWCKLNRTAQTATLKKMVDNMLPV